MVDGQVYVDGGDAQAPHDSGVGGFEEFVVVEGAFGFDVACGFVLVCFDDDAADEEPVVFAGICDGRVVFGGGLFLGMVEGGDEFGLVVLGEPGGCDGVEDEAGSEEHDEGADGG